jgi:hypothetical protein
LRYNNDLNFGLYVFVIGAFFNKRARETSAAKASLGAFPPILIAPKNAKLTRALDFQRASRIFFHAAIYQCFDNFNRSSGTVVTLQNGFKMTMAKAIILAIYCDHPAARKCCLCGSACPQCFTSKVDFAKPPMEGNMVLRTPGSVAAQKIVRFNVCFYLSFNVSVNVSVNVSSNVSFNISFNVSSNVSCNVSVNLSLNVSFNLSFNVSFNLSCNVSFNESCNVSFNVSFNICFQHLAP